MKALLKGDVKKILKKLLAANVLLQAAPSFAAGFDGISMGIAWALPFAGILLSIAFLPLMASHFWHHHYGKVAMAWALAFLLPFAAMAGLGATGALLVHAAVAEYLPFVILLTALYTISGGIYIQGNMHGSPRVNTAFLATGALLASVMGTTGASMLLIRPLVRANDNRQHKVHVIVFFIFIVSNAGGALTPLGDPPLFLGFLKGVNFFWPLRHLWAPALFLIAALLAIFYALDSYYYHRREELLPVDPTPDTPAIRIQGGWNFALLALAVGLVLLSGLWTSGVVWSLAGTTVALPGLVRDIGLLALALISFKATPAAIHQSNQFSWEPMSEVAKLFAGIFLVMAPVMAMLQAGVQGPFGAVVAAVTQADGSANPAMYFWVTGALSAFLDNAPTYLVFFNTAGGNAQQLMTTLAPTLAAISAGAVFMGACSYIGNAPNLMVKTIAQGQGIKMPSFFGYIVWALVVLLPLLLIVQLIWFV
jgi:Na+/H+ antiporter NhaD/arsenite permease-like protein